MIVTIGHKQIEISAMAEVRQLTILYRDEEPVEDSPQQTLTIPTALSIITTEGDFWSLSEDGFEAGTMPTGVYLV